MSAKTSSSTRLSKWITMAIILAVTLLSSCLVLSLIVTETFQFEVNQVFEDLPTDSFMTEVRHREGVSSLAPYINQLHQYVPGVRETARTTRAMFVKSTIITKGGQQHVLREGMLFKIVEPEFFGIRGFSLAEGRYFDAADGPNVAVIGATLAANGYKLGSIIRRPYIDKQYEVVGILQPNDGGTDHPNSALNDWKVNEMTFLPIAGMPKLHDPENIILKANLDNLTDHMQTWGQVWVGVEPEANVTTVMENTQAYFESLPGTYELLSSPTPPTKATHEYVAAQTSSSLEQMGFIVIAVGALSISGLMLMHVLLGAKVIGIKRALGATRDRLVWENLLKYSLLSLCGFLLSLALIQPLLPLIGNFLGVELQVLPQTLLYAMLGVTVLTPLCGLIPTVEASKVSPLDAIRDRLGWGLGKRRLDLRQIIVSLAFAAAVGTMFLVSQIGFGTLAGIDANLRAVGRDMLLVEEPPPGSASPIPTLTEADDASLCVT